MSALEVKHHPASPPFAQLGLNACLQISVLRSLLISKEHLVEERAVSNGHPDLAVGQPRVDGDGIGVLVAEAAQRALAARVADAALRPDLVLVVLDEVPADRGHVAHDLEAQRTHALAGGSGARRLCFGRARHLRFGRAQAGRPALLGGLSRTGNINLKSN